MFLNYKKIGLFFLISSYTLSTHAVTIHKHILEDNHTCSPNGKKQCKAVSNINELGWLPTETHDGNTEPVKLTHGINLDQCQVQILQKNKCLKTTQMSLFEVLELCTDGTISEFTKSYTNICNQHFDRPVFKEFNVYQDENKKVAVNVEFIQNALDAEAGRLLHKAMFESGENYKKLQAACEKLFENREQLKDFKKNVSGLVSVNISTDKSTICITCCESIPNSKKRQIAIYEIKALDEIFTGIGTTLNPDGKANSILRISLPFESLPKKYKQELLADGKTHSSSSSSTSSVYQTTADNAPPFNTTTSGQALSKKQHKINLHNLPLRDRFIIYNYKLGFSIDQIYQLQFNQPARTLSTLKRAHSDTDLYSKNIHEYVAPFSHVILLQDKDQSALTVRQIKDLIKLVNISKTSARERAIFKLFFAGVKADEIIALNLDDVDFENQILSVGIKQKQKINLDDLTSSEDSCDSDGEYLGSIWPESLSEALTNYISSKRVKPTKDNPLFTNKKGQRVSLRYVNTIIKRCKNQIALMD
jgi:integrase